MRLPTRHQGGCARSRSGASGGLSLPSGSTVPRCSRIRSAAARPTSRLPLPRAIGRAPPTVCLVPAALAEQWRATARQLGATIVVSTHQAASRGRLPAVRNGLVVVDEAHHFRNPRHMALSHRGALAHQPAGAARDRYPGRQSAHRSPPPAAARRPRRCVGAGRRPVAADAAGASGWVPSARASRDRVPGHTWLAARAARGRLQARCARMRGRDWGARQRSTVCTCPA